MSLKRLSINDANFDADLQRLLHRDSSSSEQNVDKQVADIIQDVRDRGDESVLELTKRYDALDAPSMSAIELSQDELKSASERISKEQLDSLQKAAARVKSYHEKQLQASWSYTDEEGNRLGQKINPMRRAGLYVPGGKAAYPSSVLMTAIPAKVAGVSELVMVVPTPNGEKNDMVLAAAYLANVDRVFTIGGAQAIAALAYGTETIPSVDTIVGPGNIYVATAKRQVFGKVGIDMIAGPSEVLVVADSTANPEWVAMDLFAQAEHDQMAQSILLTDSIETADAVDAAIEKLLPTMSRKDIIVDSLKANGATIVTNSAADYVAVIDEIAPEHLELMVANAEQLAEDVRNAGAIFIGSYSSGFADQR